MEDFCVGAVQMVSTDCVDDNLARVHRLLHQAADRGAQLVLLPEYFAHFSGRGSYAVAESFAATGEASADHQPIQHALQSWAAELGLWLAGGAVPLLERPDGTPTDDRRNRSACLLYDNRGVLRARYDKMHLFDVQVENAVGSYRESASIEPGDELRTATSPWAELGLSICFDLRFPELYRQLAMAGAEVLLVPSAFTYTTGRAHWMTLLRARAIENGCFVIAANQGGEHTPKQRTWGHSVIIDPWGEVLAEANEGEAVVTETLDAEKLAKVRRNMPLLSLRRL